MSVTVVYATMTGNTKQVAEAIAQAVGVTAQDMANGPTVTTDTVAVGYWVDKGQPNDSAVKFLQSLRGKRVFLFGTLGASPTSPHAADCKKAARMLVEKDNTVIGEFLCQGAIDPKLLAMFAKFPEGHPHAPTPESRARWAAAASHPDAADLREAAAAIRAALAMKEG